MRLVPLLTLALLTLSVATPFATADQNIQQGPVSVTTVNYDTGNGCGGGNGSHQRQATATVEALPGEKVGVWYAQYCSDGTDNAYDYEHHHNGGFIMVGRTVDGNPGPNVNVNWQDARERWGVSEWHWCYTSVYVSGVGVNVGCLPAGLRWPLAPTLP